MVLGTASNVGKSLLVAGLCRWFARAGYRVAPFKAQNMALNSAVTPDGLEIGRAQAVQAEAAGVALHVDMNPILLKPEADHHAQLVVMGKPMERIRARDYHERKQALRQVVCASLDRLRERFDLVILEGAGSPAEINLKQNDIVNMFAAKAADAPVLLVGDIDRGGVFAALVGTLELLEEDERARIKGFLINKFRGDVSLLTPGLDFLEKRTGIPVLGVIPHIPHLAIADEDSQGLESRGRRFRHDEDALRIVVIRFPRISNYDDYLPLEARPEVDLHFTTSPGDLVDADLVILPGSKATVADLEWLRAQGFEAVLQARVAAGKPVLGICGGYQMIGQSIEDPLGVESTNPHVEGLGLLPVRTRYAAEKTTTQVVGRLQSHWLLTAEGTCRGYEIHMGQVERDEECPPFIHLTERHGAPVDYVDGAVRGCVAGTLIHGLFDHEVVCDALISGLGGTLGNDRPAEGTARVSEYDRLADAIQEAVDMTALCSIVGLDPVRTSAIIGKGEKT